MLSFEHLPEGKATVGFEVCVKHVAGAGEGAVLHGRARSCSEVVDDRKLRFDVEVTEGERTIGVGTHERRVIEVPLAEAEACRAARETSGSARSARATGSRTSPR